MKKIKISFDIFLKKKIMNIFIIMELALSLCFGILVISIIDKEYEYYSITKEISEAYVYMSKNNLLDENSMLNKYQEEGKIEVTRFREENIWGYNESIDDPQKAYLLSEYHIDKVYTMDKIQEEVMKQNLINGRWYESNSITKDSDNDIECVIIGDEKDFPIGTIINGALFKFTYDKDNNSLNWEIKVKYRFKVVGTLGETSDIFTFNTQANPPESLLIRDMFDEVNYGVDNFFEKISINYSSKKDNLEKDNEEKNVTILCSSNDIYNDNYIYEEGMIANNDKNAMFTFNEEVTDEEKEEIIDILKKEASVTSFDNTKNNEKALAINSITSYLPLVICFMAITIAALICTSILTYINNQKMIDTFVICGMSYNDGIKINIMYSLIVIISSLLIAFIIWTTLSIFGVIPWDNMNFGDTSIVYVLINIIIDFIIINIVNSITLKKEYKYEK